MKFKTPQTLEGIAQILDCEYVGEADFPVLGMNEIHVVQPGDIVFVEMPEAGDSFGQVESVKSTSDLMCGVAGVVAEVVERGYALGGKVLKPSKVVVSLGKPVEEKKAGARYDHTTSPPSGRVGRIS